MTSYIKLPVIDKKIKQPKRWLLGLLAAGILAGGTTYGLQFVNRGTNKQDVIQQTIPVTSQSITLRITASGKIVPFQTVNISPKNPGILSQIYVEQGDRVQQGQVIARMDTGDIEAQILQQRANLAQAQAQLDQAKAGSRPQEIAQAKARLTQAQAQLAAAKAGGRSEDKAQARARLAQAQAQLAAAKAGNRTQEIQQAQAQVNSARAQLELTEARVNRYRKLAQQGAISQDQLDQYLTEDRRARAALEEAQRRVSLLQSGTRTEEIAQRSAQVNEAQAALRLLENPARPEEIARLQAAVAEAQEQVQLLQSGTRPEEIAQREAGVKAAQAQLQATQVRLNDTVIRAPYAGIVTQKYSNVGAYVSPATSASSDASATSTAIVAIARGLEVRANVPEVDIGRIKVGQTVEIKADAFPDQVFKGSVRLIAPEAVVEQGVTSFQVRVGIDTGEDRLRSGLNVDLTFLGDTVNNALVVPTVAIVTEKGQTGVLVPDEKGQPKFQEITIGSQIKDQTQIVEGLNQGDRIFLNPPKDYKRQQGQQR